MGPPSGVGVGVSLISRGVGVGVSSAVASGEGSTTLGTGVGVAYLPLTSSPLPPRVMNQAIRTPDIPRTRTIANTHGSALLLGSSRTLGAAPWGGRI